MTSANERLTTHEKDNNREGPATMTTLSHTLEKQVGLWGKGHQLSYFCLMNS